MLPETKLCADCREEIPQKRLIAQPTARYCLTCQTWRERRKLTITIPDSVLASCGETDDMTSARECGWGEVAHPSRVHLTE